MAQANFRTLKKFRKVDSRIANYLAEADDETVHCWLTKTGSYLVYMGDWHKPSEFNVPLGNLIIVLTVSIEHLQRFTLEAFPENYKLYIHYKGNKSEPRRDAYLYGA